MRILLLSGAISKYEKHGDYGKAAPQMHPYGALCLAAVLEKNGFTDIKILDTELKNLSNEQILDEIRKFCPDIIGVTVYTLAVSKITQLLREIKQAFDNVILVAGGPHVTLYPEELVKNRVVDYCCAGEGEYPLLKLVQAIDNAGPVSGIPNLVFSHGERVVHNPSQAFIENLDELPFPSFHLLKDDINKYYPQPMTYIKRPFATLITSRGCPYDCKFCSAKAMWTRKWRFNSASYIADMVEYLIDNFGIKEVCFFEDSFSVSRNRVIEFCDLLLKRKLDIIWSASVNIKDIDEEVARRMRDAGCWLISCGIETGNAAVMKVINKPLTIEEVEEKLKMVDRLGIKIRGYFMLGHITDTKATIRQTIDFSKSLPLYSANYSIFTPTPGSDFYDSIYYQDKKPEYYKFATYASAGKEIIFTPNGLDANYLVHIQRKAFAEFFFRFPQILLYLRSLRSYEAVRRFAIMCYAGIILAARIMRARFISLSTKQKEKIYEKRKNN